MSKLDISGEKVIHEFCQKLWENKIERYNTDNGYTIVTDKEIADLTSLNTRRVAVKNKPYAVRFSR